MQSYEEPKHGEQEGSLPRMEGSLMNRCRFGKGLGKVKVLFTLTKIVAKGLDLTGILVHCLLLLRTILIQYHALGPLVQTLARIYALML